MKLAQIEKLINFCNEVIIQRNDECKGLCAYFEYKGIQYYASLIWDNHKGADFAIFPALDKSVKSWNSLYHTNEVDLVTNKEFRECVFNFLISL